MTVKKYAEQNDEKNKTVRCDMAHDSHGVELSPRGRKPNNSPGGQETA